MSGVIPDKPNKENAAEGRTHKSEDISQWKTVGVQAPATRPPRRVTDKHPHVNMKD